MMSKLHLFFHIAMFFSRKVIITLSIILQLLMSNRFTFTVSYFKRKVNGRELMPFLHKYYGYKRQQIAIKVMFCNLLVFNKIQMTEQS